MTHSNDSLWWRNKSLAQWTELLITFDKSSIMKDTYPLSESAQNYFRLSGIIVYVVLLLLSIVGSTILFVSTWQMPPWWYFVSWIVVMALLAYLMIVLYPVKKYQRTRWRFDDKGLFIYQGIWWRKQYAVPRSRVQHIDVTQGPIQRNYQISELVLHTAGTMNASVSLTGLSHDKAVEIRDELLNQDEFDAV